MSDSKVKQEKASNYLKHCSQCPHNERTQDGKPTCVKLDGGGYGQLPMLVKEGMPCPVGKFGGAKPEPKPEPKPEVVEEEQHFIFKILESCKSATFHFDDGDLTWTKK